MRSQRQTTHVEAFTTKPKDASSILATSILLRPKTSLRLVFGLRRMFYEAQTWSEAEFLSIVGHH